jgi:hypothetical protein
MRTWVQAFLGFPPPLGIPSIANRLVFNACIATVRRCRSRREPKPHNKQKAKQCQWPKSKCFLDPLSRENIFRIYGSAYFRNKKKATGPKGHF